MLGKRCLAHIAWLAHNASARRLALRLKRHLTCLCANAWHTVLYFVWLAHNANARRLASSLKHHLPCLCANAWQTVLGTHCLVGTRCKRPEAGVETQTLLATCLRQRLAHRAWHTLLICTQCKRPGAGVEPQTLLAIFVCKCFANAAWHILLGWHTMQAPGRWHRASNAA
jgi:hypothetical protein